MTPQTSIDTAVKRVLASTHPSKIIMFGSRARENAAEDSDLDLLVIESRVPSKIKEMARLRWALREGKVLYEAPH